MREMTVHSFWPPDWRSSAPYSGYETWSSKRWAWEFLRRNSEFQWWCNKVEELVDPDARLQGEVMCSRLFSLSAYKHYSEPFDEGAQPQFTRLMRVLTHTDAEPDEHDLNMYRGDVLVKVNVRHLQTETSIQDHLQWYGDLLRQVRTQIHAESPKATKPQPAKLALYLRLLDATDAGVHQQAMGPALFPEKLINADGLQRSPDEWHEFLKNRIRKARHFALDGWTSMIES
jgi:hypothetical protein